MCFGLVAFLPHSQHIPKCVEGHPTRAGHSTVSVDCSKLLFKPAGGRDTCAFLVGESDRPPVGNLRGKAEITARDLHSRQRQIRQRNVNSVCGAKCSSVICTLIKYKHLCMQCLDITQRFLFQRGSDLQRSSHQRVRLSLSSFFFFSPSHRALKFVSCPGGSSYQKHSANLKRGAKALGNTAPFVPLLRAPRAGVTAESRATAASQASWDHSGHSCTNPFMEQKRGAESNMASVGVLCLMRHMSEPLTLCCFPHAA